MNKVKFMAVIAAAAMVMTGCATSGTTVATVGSEKITSNDVEFFIDECMVPTGDREADVQEAVDTLVENATIMQVAKKLGYDLSDEEQSNLSSKVASVRKQYGGTKKYSEMIKEAGISEDFVANLLSVTTFKDKLVDELNPEISDEDKKEYFDNNYYRAEHVLIMTSDADTGDEYNDEQKAQAKQRAEDILNRAKAGEDFKALVAEYSEDPGSKVNPNGYIFTDKEMVSEFEECVKSLEPGEVGFCESNYGYHVIKRYALDEDQEFYDHNLFDRDNSIINILTDEYLDEQLKTWADENNISIKRNDSAIEKMKNASKDDE